MKNIIYFVDKTTLIMSLIYLNRLRAGMTARRRKNSKWAWLSYRDCSTVRVQNRPTLVQYTAHVHIMHDGCMTVRIYDNYIKCKYASCTVQYDSCTVCCANMTVVQYAV